MISRDFPEISQASINMHIQEAETPSESEDNLQGWLSNIEIHGI